MSKIRGLVSRIIPFSSVDGPGNRLVIFLQGCNLDCINCHNPHTIGSCNYCGICVAECPGKALTLVTRQPEMGKNGTVSSCEGVEEESEVLQQGPAQGNTPAPRDVGGVLRRQQIQFDPDLCQNCDHCLEVCPKHSNPRAQWMDVTDILAEIRPVAPFLSGITISGGEATQQLEFVQELFSEIKDEASFSHLTTFIDSNGMLPVVGWEQVLPVLDGAMIDLKAIRPEVHQQLTGRSNEQVLASIRYLWDAEKLHEVRILIIPDYNDQLEQLEELISFLTELDSGLRIRLIPFRRHGVRQEYQKLKPASAELMEEIMTMFREQGLENIIIT